MTVPFNQNIISSKSTQVICIGRKKQLYILKIIQPTKGPPRPKAEKTRIKDKYSK